MATVTPAPRLALASMAGAVSTSTAPSPTAKRTTTASAASPSFHADFAKKATVFAPNAPSPASAAPGKAVTRIAAPVGKPAIVIRVAIPLQPVAPTSGACARRSSRIGDLANAVVDTGDKRVAISRAAAGCAKTQKSAATALWPPATTSFRRHGCLQNGPTACLDCRTALAAGHSKPPAQSHRPRT